MEKMIWDYALDEVLLIIQGRIDVYNTLIQLEGEDNVTCALIAELQELEELLKKLKYY